jgi:hypothetical protein
MAIAPIEDLLGEGAHSRMTGYYIDPSSPANYLPVNFEGGSVRAIYKFDMLGKPHLYTMFPIPIPGTHP